MGLSARPSFGMMGGCFRTRFLHDLSKIAMIQFACPACRQLLEHSTPGSPVKCPTCGNRCEVPYPEVVAAAATQGPATRTKGPNEKYCHECGQAIRARAEICPKCGVRQPLSDYDSGALGDPAARQVGGNKIAAGICGILVGGFGIHKFILGMTGPGLIMLLVSLLTCGVGWIVMWVIGLIEGIIYLTKSDEDFYKTYVIGKKEWF